MHYWSFIFVINIDYKSKYLYQTKMEQSTYLLFSPCLCFLEKYIATQSWERIREPASPWSWVLQYLVARCAVWLAGVWCAISAGLVGWWRDDSRCDDTDLWHRQPPTQITLLLSREDNNRRAALRIYANQTTCPLWPLHWSQVPISRLLTVGLMPV